MLRIFFQQRKLLIGAAASVELQRAVMLPELGSCAMLHEAALLKRLNATVFLILQSAADCLVETACGEVGLNAGIDRLRAMLVKPRVQFFQFTRRQGLYRAFDLLNRVHGPLHHFSGEISTAGARVQRHTGPFSRLVTIRELVDRGNCRSAIAEVGTVLRLPTAAVKFLKRPSRSRNWYVNGDLMLESRLTLTGRTTRNEKWDRRAPSEWSAPATWQRLAA
jgi:hypothetical protein